MKKRFFVNLDEFFALAFMFIVAAALFVGCPQTAENDEQGSARYTITFDSHGGSTIDPITELGGSLVEEPEDYPEKAGYTFTGWFSEEEGGTLYSWPHTLEADVTMHAQWWYNNDGDLQEYTITFDSHSGSPVQSITVSGVTAVQKPTNPIRTGFIFTGWFSATTGGTLYSWPYTLNADVTMHAQWLPEGGGAPTLYTITFDSHGGSTVQSITMYGEGTVEKPADPVKANQIFTGWFSAASGGTKYTWPYTLNASVTMHAQWRTKEQYTITFNSHEGSTVQSITQAEGTQVHKPTNPVKEGFAFSGWFSAETDGIEYTWPHTLTANVTMHAVWQSKTTVNIIVWVTSVGDILTSGDDVTISKSGLNSTPNSFTANVTDDYSGIQWYLDSTPISGSTSDSITINATDYGVNGSYYLGVTVTKNSIPYSTVIHFTVTD